MLKSLFDGVMERRARGLLDEPDDDGQRGIAVLEDEQDALHRA